MSKVIMTANDYINRLKTLANSKTFYKNKWNYNLGLVAPPKSTKTFSDCKGRVTTNINPYNEIAKSFDCSNLVKAIVNGYDVNNNSVGYYQAYLSNTGDCTEKGLLDQCTGISSDFKNIKAPALLYMSGHIGSYIGITPDNRFNVIECTNIWGGGVIYSWVDQDGTRRSENGGKPVILSDGTYQRWTKYGYLTPWVSYDNNVTVSAPKTETPKTTTSNKKSVDVIAQEVVDGKWGNNPQRKIKLVNAGYDYNEVQKKVNEILSKPKKGYSYHIVKKGESLSSIAKLYGTTWQNLMKLNNIKNPNLVFPGERIRVK